MEIAINKKPLKVVGLLMIPVVILLVIQMLANKGNSQARENNDIDVVAEQQIIAERIEVIHFHATQQCWSCIVAGDFAEKTLKNRFPEELESGRVLFKSINYELPENSEITQKYRASGSSIFINLIYDNQDHISEDVQVWRLLNSEIQFRRYLGDKLEQYL